MAQQTLRTVIVLSGRIDNTFGKVGESLITLGNEIDTISQKIIGFGKESTKEFVEYDDIMREVQALGEYDTKTMRALDEYNKSIAQTSKYTMEQAAQAEVLMAQLGLNMDDTRTLMPTVMNLATAANIELADSLDYLYYTLNALGLPMEQANILADQMSKASAISAADIDTLGQSLQRLGSGAQFFTGGSDEILAILAGISQFGSDMQGSDAGTQLRNFMLTLMAPTKGKAEILDSMAISESEWAEFEAYMEDAGIELTETAAAMEKLGFSIYDSSGQLKPAIQIIAELKAALAGMSEEEKNATLGSLFGKRTTITASNLLEALDDIIFYQEQIENGSTGYTDYMAGIQEGGLGGALREFNSTLDALETTVGKLIAPEVESAADTLTGMINDIANMDAGKMEIIAGGLAGIAAAGPGLLLAGGAFRLIGYVLGSKAGIIAFGATALAALAGAAIKWDEVKFEDKFGSMELNSQPLLDYVNGIGSAFEDSYTDINNYNNALDTAVQNYTTASATLSSDLLTNMITGATLTQEQIASIEGLGKTMGDELLAGISASFDKSASYLTMLYGGLDEAAGDEEFAGAIMLANTMYESLVGQAEKLGREFGETLGSAMDDGIITGDEYNAIMKKMQEYNDAMAFVVQADLAAEQAQQLYKAQSVTWESAEAFLEEQERIYAENIAEAEMTHIGEKAKWGVYYDEAISKGWINPITGAAYTEDDKTAFLAEMDQNYADKIQGYTEQNAKVVQAMVDALLSQSELADTWAFLKQVQADGVPDDINQLDWSKYSQYGTPDELQKALLDFVYADSSILSMFTGGGRLSDLLEPYLGDAVIQAMFEAVGLADELALAAQDYNLRQAQLGTQAIIGGTATGEAFSTEMDVVGGAEAAQEAHDEAQGIMDAALEQSVEVDDNGSAERLYAEMRTIFAKPIYQSIYARRIGGIGYGGGNIMGFADGGRATVASIFGEAGPEWAIPEEHTDRTAQLLNAAREGAGFTWRELIERNGGLNAGGGGSRTLVYQPTIIAQDASGVEDKLIEDKNRLDKWYAEKELRDDVEVYS